MLFLIDVDHGSFEKAKETRQINLQAATVSLQVVISLCKRKETAALKLSFKTADGESNLKIGARNHLPRSNGFFLSPDGADNLLCRAEPMCANRFLVLSPSAFGKMYH